MDTKRLPSELLAPLNRPQPNTTLPADVQRALLALLDGLQHAVDRTEQALVRGDSMEEACRALIMVTVHSEVIAACVRADFAAANRAVEAARKRSVGS
jgi:hypothetical protein